MTPRNPVVSILAVLAIFSVTPFAYADADDEAVGPIPRPEHPRPDAKRAEWINLNGLWEFGETNHDDSNFYLSGTPYPETIRVPFCREAPLSGIERREPVKHVWYRRMFHLPPEWSSPRARLHIGASDWETRVWINDTLFGTHTGGSTPAVFDITRRLRAYGNMIVVHVRDEAASGLQPLGKQSPDGQSAGILHTPTTGIWQTVWIEGVGSTFLDEIHIRPDLGRACVHVGAVLDGPVEGLTLRAEVFADGAKVGEGSVPARQRDSLLTIPLDTVRPWAPGDPFLYDVALALTRGEGESAQIVDRIESYFGLRDIRIEGRAILLNDEPLFQRLILDQGFYPDGIWTAPSDEALRGDIERAQALGFNGARLHQKVFEPRYLYWADKLGFLVWGEYPSFGANYADARVHLPILREWSDVVVRDRNHPSIVGWCAFNETPPEAAPLQAAVVEVTRRLDPTRPVLETSGWTHTLSRPEVLDAHDYDPIPERFRMRWGDSVEILPEQYGILARPRVPFMISEFGGIGFDPPKGTRAYGDIPKTETEFLERFRGLVDVLLDNPLHFGFCYTQLADVEQEANGLYTENRTPKFDVETIRALVARQAAYEKTPPLELPRLPTVDWTILIGSYHYRHLSWSWWYTTEEPAENWACPGYPFWEWETAGRPPFGRKKGPWEAKIRTPWDTSAIWLRQDTHYRDTPFDRAILIVHYDEDVEIFLNGEPIWKGIGWNDRYEAFDVTDAVRAHLVPGMNSVGAHLRNSGGGQYFDMALLLGKAR